jgi:CMP-2-keto-3-deoxyoctulosonic acid synthetase
MAVWNVRANYDPEARVWYSVEGDMPALLVEGDTIDQLAKKAGDMLIDLLEINKDILSAEQLAGPHAIRVIAHHERDFAVAA